MNFKCLFSPNIYQLLLIQFYILFEVWMLPNYLWLQAVFLSFWSTYTDFFSLYNCLMIGTCPQTLLPFWILKLNDKLGPKTDLGSSAYQIILKWIILNENILNIPSSSLSSLISSSLSLLLLLLLFLLLFIIVMIRTMIMVMIMTMIMIMTDYDYDYDYDYDVVHVLTKSKAIKVEERMAKVSAGQYWITLSAWISTTGIFFCETFII